MIDEASQSSHADAGPVERPVVPLVERLRGACGGYEEWRVQDPNDGAYCIAYSWPDSHYPEREARAWLADQQARFPEGRVAGYVVACVRVVPAKDQLLSEAADALDDQSRDIARAVESLECWRRAFPDAWGLLDQQALAALKRHNVRASRPSGAAQE